MMSMRSRNGLCSDICPRLLFKPARPEAWQRPCLCRIRSATPGAYILRYGAYGALNEVDVINGAETETCLRLNCENTRPERCPVKLCNTRDWTQSEHPWNGMVER